MKNSLVIALFAMGLGVMILNCSTKNGLPSVKAMLIQQLKNSYTTEDWFVPLKISLEGITAEQSNWKDSTDNHSIRELVSHLIFWNERMLIAFQGNTPPEFNDDNELTFRDLDREDWSYAVRKIDSIQVEWELVTENATEEQLIKWSSSVANICAHNAYHTGQIVYIRKQNGWWR